MHQYFMLAFPLLLPQSWHSLHSVLHCGSVRGLAHVFHRHTVLSVCLYPGKEANSSQARETESSGLYLSYNIQSLPPTPAKV